MGSCNKFEKLITKCRYLFLTLCFLFTGCMNDIENEETDETGVLQYYLASIEVDDKTFIDALRDDNENLIGIIKLLEQEQENHSNVICQQIKDELLLLYHNKEYFEFYIAISAIYGNPALKKCLNILVDDEFVIANIIVKKELVMKGILRSYDTIQSLITEANMLLVSVDDPDTQKELIEIITLCENNLVLDKIREASMFLRQIPNTKQEYNISAALSALQSIIDNYPSSPYTPKAICLIWTILSFYIVPDGSKNTQEDAIELYNLLLKLECTSANPEQINLFYQNKINNLLIMFDFYKHTQEFTIIESIEMMEEITRIIEKANLQLTSEQIDSLVRYIAYAERIENMHIHTLERLTTLKNIFTQL